MLVPRNREEDIVKPGSARLNHRRAGKAGEMLARMTARCVLMVLMSTGVSPSAHAAIQGAPVLSTSAKADFLKSIRDKPSQLTDAGKAHLAFESNWLIGDGTIQDAVGQKGKVPASGSIGLQHESARYDNNVLGLERETSVERFLVFYGFGTSVDTVRGDKPTTFATAI